jgi:primosomal protein N'
LHQWPTLSAGQQRALTLALTSPDQMLAWQGLPGSGKTFVLQAFKQSTEAQGFSVRGFAPSAEAANVLGKEAGLPTDTVASLLHAPAPDSAPGAST